MLQMMVLSMVLVPSRSYRVRIIDPV